MRTPTYPLWYVKDERDEVAAQKRPAPEGRFSDYSIFKTRHAVLSKGRSLAFDLAEAKRYPGLPNKEKGTFKIMDFPS